jgi:hypothetical protein
MESIQQMVPSDSPLITLAQEGVEVAGNIVAMAPMVGNYRGEPFGGNRLHDWAKRAGSEAASSASSNKRLADNDALWQIAQNCQQREYGPDRDDLQGMKTRMFSDLEAKGKNWYKELPSVLQALWTDINGATRDTLFHLVYGADAVLPPEIFLESARVAQFNEEDQAEERELDSNLLEEKCNKALANVRKYQESLKCYYNKSVIPKELKIGNLVLKKDIRTKDKYKFSSP